jgi:hypothetical protein
MAKERDAGEPWYVSEVEAGRFLYGFEKQLMTQAEFVGYAQVVLREAERFKAEQGKKTDVVPCVNAIPLKDALNIGAAGQPRPYRLNLEVKSCGKKLAVTEGPVVHARHAVEAVYPVKDITVHVMFGEFLPYADRIVSNYCHGRATLAKDFAKKGNALGSFF